MHEVYAEFDLLDYGFATGYFYGKDYDECKKKVLDELEVWGGGSVDIYDEDGDYLGYMEY